MKRRYSRLSLRKFIVLGTLLLGLAGGYALYHKYQNFASSASLSQPYLLKYSNESYEIKIKNQDATQANNINLNNNYVSIAQFDPQFFVTANYGNLFLLDLAKNERCILVPDIDPSKIIGLQAGAENKIKLTEPPIYNPTGVYIDEAGDLFVANYKGNNILRGRVDKNNCRVGFVQSFSSENSGGPENVAVDRDNDILVSANYDAGTATAFRLSSGAPLWTATIGEAHGVAIKGDKVYVTGLTKRKIYELALSDGRILRSTGSFGWDPLNNQFLWPTSIYPVGENELVIADPQTGFISFFDREKFAVTRYTGGNGSGNALFNYPYTVFPTDNSLYILSSMRGEMIETDLSASQALKRYRFRVNQWPDLPESITPFGQGWNGYVNAGGPTLNLNNKPYKLGYGQLFPAAQNLIFKTPDPIFNVPNIATLYNFGPYLYFLQGGQVSPEMLYFFSSSSTSLLGIYQQPGKPALLLYKKIPLDSWLINHELVSSNGEKLSESEIKNQFSAKAARYYNEIEKRGWLPLEDLFQQGDSYYSADGMTFDDFAKYLDALFVSPEGRAFKLIYDQCTVDNCDKDNLKVAAKDYYFNILEQSYINLDEYLLVGMLAGVSAEDAAPKQRTLRTALTEMIRFVRTATAVQWE